jgi:hypothetical protein
VYFRSKAGGWPNTHHYGRATDIRKVDGKPVRGNGADSSMLNVGEILAELSPHRRPDQIIGPPNWREALGRSRQEGWILDGDQLALHNDHPHIGYERPQASKHPLTWKPTK